MTNPTDNDRLRMSLRHLGHEKGVAPRARRSQVRATPAARRYAREKGITLDEVHDLTSCQRITERDVDVAIEKKRIMNKRVQREISETERLENTRPVEPVLDATPEKPAETAEASDDAAEKLEDTAATTENNADNADDKAENTENTVETAETVEAADKTDDTAAADDTEKNEDIKTNDTAETETADNKAEENANKVDEAVVDKSETSDEAVEEVAPAETDNEDAADESAAEQPTAPKITLAGADDKADAADEHRPPVSPLAQELADEAGVDVSQIKQGSGPNGRIVRYDVRRLIQSLEAEGQDATPKENEAEEAAEPESSEAVRETPDETSAVQAIPDVNKEAEEQSLTPVENTVEDKTEAAPEKTETVEPEKAETAVSEEAAEAETAAAPEKIEKPTKPADPVDTIEMRPITLSLTANASRLARVLNRADKGVTASDYLLAAAQRILAEHPTVGLIPGGGVSLITLSDTDGLVETPAFTETSVAAIARQREDYLKGIRCNRFDKHAFEGTGLAVMTLDGIESESGCAGSGRPILFCGAIHEAGNEAPGRFNMQISLSLPRKAQNVAASVAFLQAFKDAIDKGAFEEEEA